MGKQIGDNITPADCLAYAEACESWAVRAKTDDARARLLEMARSWRELGSHLRGTKGVDSAKSDRPAKAKAAMAKLKSGRSAAARPAGRRPQ